MARNKGPRDIENHCGYLISLVLAKSPFEKTIYIPRQKSQVPVPDLALVQAKSKTHCETVTWTTVTAIVYACLILFRIWKKQVSFFWSQIVTDYLLDPQS